jgi:hypothetical protein
VVFGDVGLIVSLDLKRDIDDDAEEKNGDRGEDEG